MCLFPSKVPEYKALGATHPTLARSLSELLHDTTFPERDCSKRILLKQKEMHFESFASAAGDSGGLVLLLLGVFLNFMLQYHSLKVGSEGFCFLQASSGNHTHAVPPLL